MRGISQHQMPPQTSRGLRKKGTPNIEPQIAGFPYNQTPIRCPYLRRPPILRLMLRCVCTRLSLFAAQGVRGSLHKRALDPGKSALFSKGCWPCWPMAAKLDFKIALPGEIRLLTKTAETCASYSDFGATTGDAGDVEVPGHKCADNQMLSRRSKVRRQQLAQVESFLQPGLNICLL